MPLVGGGGGGVRKAEGHEMRSIYLIMSIPLLIDGAFFCTIVQIHIKEFKKIYVCQNWDLKGQSWVKVSILEIFLCKPLPRDIFLERCSET